MHSVKQHYGTLLAERYSWILGDFDTRIQEWEEWLRVHVIFPHSSGMAIDLGAGSGLPAIPLARLGFQVLALDFSPLLLRELNKRKGYLPIDTLEADIMDFPAYTHVNPELISCTTDTLFHLPSQEDVARVVDHSFSILSAGGKLLLSFRDYSQELTGDNRFIPVRSDENRTFTCFLEYFPDYVQVHDLVWEKEQGNWQQKVSSYRKLRISPDEIQRMLTHTGFTVQHTENRRGVHYIIAAKA